jgi:hypothetical protein
MVILLVVPGALAEEAVGLQFQALQVLAVLTVAVMEQQVVRLAQVELIPVVVVAVADMVVPVVLAALVLSSSAILVHSAAQAAQSHHQADTPSIHSLLLGHTQHEQYQNSG